MSRQIQWYTKRHDKVQWIKKSCGWMKMSCQKSFRKFKKYQENCQRYWKFINERIAKHTIFSLSSIAIALIKPYRVIGRWIHLDNHLRYKKKIYVSIKKKKKKSWPFHFIKFKNSKFYSVFRIYKKIIFANSISFSLNLSLKKYLEIDDVKNFIIIVLTIIIRLA